MRWYVADPSNPGDVSVKGSAVDELPDQTARAFIVGVDCQTWRLYGYVTAINPLGELYISPFKTTSNQITEFLDAKSDLFDPLVAWQKMVQAALTGMDSTKATNVAIQVLGDLMQPHAPFLREIADFIHPESGTWKLLETYRVGYTSAQFPPSFEVGLS